MNEFILLCQINYGIDWSLCRHVVSVDQALKPAQYAEQPLKQKSSYIEQTSFVFSINCK